jgi:hypothetical protein
MQDKAHRSHGSSEYRRRLRFYQKWAQKRLEIGIIIGIARLDACTDLTGESACRASVLHMLHMLPSLVASVSNFSPNLAVNCRRNCKVTLPFSLYKNPSILPPSFFFITHNIRWESFQQRLQDNLRHFQFAASTAQIKLLSFDLLFNRGVDITIQIFRDTHAMGIISTIIPGQPALFFIHGHCRRPGCVVF